MGALQSVNPQLPIRVFHLCSTLSYTRHGVAVATLVREHKPQFQT